MCLWVVRLVANKQPESESESEPTPETVGTLKSVGMISDEC